MCFFAVLLTAVNYSQLYEGSPSDGKMRITEGIVDKLVPIHDANRVRPRLSLDNNANDPAPVLAAISSVTGIALRYEGGLINRRDFVCAYPMIEAVRVDSRIRHVEPQGAFGISVSRTPQQRLTILFHRQRPGRGGLRQHNVLVNAPWNKHRSTRDNAAEQH